VETLLKVTSEILNFAQKPLIDESIQEYEYYEHDRTREQPLAALVKLL